MTKLVIVAFVSIVLLTLANVVDFFFVNHDEKATMNVELGILVGVFFFGIMLCIIDATKKD